MLLTWLMFGTGTGSRARCSSVHSTTSGITPATSSRNLDIEQRGRLRAITHRPPSHLDTLHDGRELAAGMAGLLLEVAVVRPVLLVVAVVENRPDGGHPEVAAVVDPLGRAVKNDRVYGE